MAFLPPAEGRRAWAKLHQTVDSLSCEECRLWGKKFISYMHDLTNLKLRRELYDKENFEEMQGIMKNISNKNEDELRDMFISRGSGDSHCPACERKNKSLINAENNNNSSENMAKENLKKALMPIGSIFIGRAVQELEKTQATLSQPLFGPLTQKNAINIFGGLAAILYGSGMIGGKGQDSIKNVVLLAGATLLVDEVTDVLMAQTTTPPAVVRAVSMAPRFSNGGGLIQID